MDIEEDIKILKNLIDALNSGMCKFGENTRLDNCGYQEAIEHIYLKNMEI